MFFAGISFKLENIYITFSGFNPYPSLPSVKNRRQETVAISKIYTKTVDSVFRAP